VQRLENQQGVLEDDSFADREPMKLLQDRSDMVLVSLNYSVYNVRSQLQWLDVVCEQLFLLSYSTRRTYVSDVEHNLLAIAKFLVDGSSVRNNTYCLSPDNYIVISINV